MHSAFVLSRQASTERLRLRACRFARGKRPEHWELGVLWPAEQRRRARSQVRLPVQAARRMAQRPEQRQVTGQPETAGDSAIPAEAAQAGLPAE